jgi:hypothetical protein
MIADKSKLGNWVLTSRAFEVALTCWIVFLVSGAMWILAHYSR